jgi:hypothetical protein
MIDRLNGDAPWNLDGAWVEQKSDRRSGKTECSHKTGRGACRIVARWRCEACERITCASHILWLGARPVCSACEQALIPLMQRSGERRKHALLPAPRPSSTTELARREGAVDIGVG